MTQEEKARAYDEALEKATTYYDNAKVAGDHSTVARYENIFPELAESEDERIRKEMIAYFEDIKEVATKSKSLDEWIIWLKKQKEQKPDSLTKCVFSKEDERFIRDCANILIANDYETSAKRLLAMFEQKPAEWSEEDEKTINDACCWIAEYAGYLMDKNYGKAFMLMGLTDKLKSLRPSWKPSEEQMMALKDVAYGTYQNGDGPILRDFYEQLKKFKED